jgi:hypothetical protein
LRVETKDTPVGSRVGGCKRRLGVEDLAEGRSAGRVFDICKTSKRG